MGGCFCHASQLGNELKALPPGASSERDLTWFGFSALADLSSDGSRVLFTELPEGAAEGGRHVFATDRWHSGRPFG